MTRSLRIRSAAALLVREGVEVRYIGGCLNADHVEVHLLPFIREHIPVAHALNYAAVDFDRELLTLVFLDRPMPTVPLVVRLGSSLVSLLRRE